ncbi:hypothetical protein KIPB_015976, partial [Kipferlia bialata]|eukprot:g15976.t1
MHGTQGVWAMTMWMTCQRSGTALSA